MRERPAAYMMIDADEEPRFQTFEARPLDAVALQDDGRFVVSVDAVGLQDAIGEGQRLVDTRHRIMQHDIGLLAEAAKNLAAGECGPDRVAVGSGVRGEHEAVPLLDVVAELPSA